MAEKENRIHSLALSFLGRQQIIPNLYADQIIRGYKEGYHQAEKDLEVKEVDYERELSKYVSNGIHRFFPNVNDDYCKMDSVIWQDYVIETAKHFYELGLKAKGE